MKVPDLITSAHAEPGRAETPELSLNRSLRDSKPVSLEEKIAQEHTIRRNEGRESSQTLIPTNPLAGVSLGSSLSSSLQAQLHDFIFSLALGQGKKNKGSLVGDAEIEELIRQHPELSAYIKELKQARDEALRNAEQKQQSPLQSKDNLLAKLDVIATLLEGAPIAPALRMGDMTAKEVFVAASKREFGDEDGAILAEHTWDLAWQHAVKRAEMAARAQAGESAALLAREEGPSLEEREAINEKRRNFEAHIRDEFGVDSAVSRHLIAAFGQFEDSERARLVTEHAWELQVRARVSEGRVGEENAKAQLREYIESQSDLLNRCGEFKELLTQHLGAAREEGRHLRERCDQSARDLRIAFEGLGTDEALVYSSLENRSQYELRIIRERYQEMYGEHVRDRLASELSEADLARAMQAYQGDVANRGYAGRAISVEQADALLVVNPEAAAQALLSNDAALLAALQIHDQLRDSGTSALVVAEIVRRSNLDGSALSAAEATLGLPSALEVLRASSALSERADTEILARRERCGVRIVESALRGEEISDELTTEYAALEYAAFGMQLGAAESQEAPNLDYLQRLQAEHVHFQDSLKGIFSDYPGLAETLDASADEFRVYARVAGISQVSAEHGEKLGLLYGASSDAVVRRQTQLAERHAAYLQSQQQFLSQHPAAAEQVQAAKESGIRRGIDTMESVRKSVQQLQAGIEGLGTNEEKCFAALQGKSPAELKLIRDLYKERCGESLELSVEGDFSEAELDKMHALLVSDHIGVAAADANIALSGFWGVDQDRLRAVLRSLENTSQRTEFKQRFDSKYAGNFYRANGEDEPPTQASSFEQVLSFQMSGDSLLAAQALFEGDYHRADAALLHADLDGFWGKDAAAAAKRIEGFTTSTGRLDSARVDAVALAFSKEYGTALRSDAQQIEGPQGRWLVALVDGDEVDAAAHKLRFAMGNSVDGTEEKMLREPFTMPPALQARLHAEEQAGAVSEQTRTELFEWSQFREAVVQRYSDADMYPTRDLLVDLRSELNDHHFRMVKTLINGGLLSKADLIADACAGAGTDEAVVLRETAHLSKLQAQALAEDFEKSGYGNLRTVLRSELSGDEEFDALENVDGLPESSLEMLQYAQRRARHEDSGILSGLVWGGEREEMRQDLALLDKAISGNADAHEIDALYRRFGVSASAFREQKNFVSDVIVNTGTTVIMVGGTVVMIVGSGGTATPGAVAMWSIYLAGTAGVVRAGTKWAIRGEGYGNEELALDGGIMLIDMASASLVAKIPVGRIAAQRLEVLLGEIAAQRGAAVIAEDGTKITGEAMLRYLTQSSRGLRMVVGATQGSIDGAIFAPIQTAGITALHEQTWQDGFGTGMLRIGEASLQSVPAGVTVGGISGASMAFRTPAFIKNGQPLSLRESAKASQDASLTESGRELLLQRETSKGFITRGDVADARLSSTGVGPERSAELIAGMKNSTQTRFTEGDIKLFETKLRQQGTLSKLDEHLILDTSPNQYVASISEKEIQKRVVATKREVLKLELQSSVQGLASSQREVLQSQLSTVQDRLLALEDTLRHIAAAKASSATRASGSQLEVAATGSSSQEKPRENADPSAAENTELRSQVAAQEELVARLERDLLDPKTAKFKEVIEESLGKQREILGELKRSAANTADPLPTESSAASSASEEGNPWAYDPSESFAKELEARARGDFDEPLDNGWRSNEPFPRDPTPGSYGSDGPALQRAPQRARTRVMVAELPEPQAARTSAASRMQIDDLGVVASRTEIDLGQALFEEALVKAPAVETEAVLTVKPKVSPKPAASPSIEEILQPQFDQAVFDPATAPHTATESKTLTPMLALGRVIKPALGTLTQSGNSAERRAKHDSPKPATSPQVLTEEALKKSATKTTREGRGIGTEVDERQIAENERVHRIEEKKHKQEMARSEKKGGARLRFSKVIDALGDEDLIIEDEEAGQV